MYRKKNFRYLFTAFFILNTLQIHPEETKDGCSNDNCNNIDNLFEPSITELTPPTPATGDNCIDAAAILRLITCPTGLINVPKILQEDLYLKTVGPVTIRSLLDKPSLMHPIVYDTCLWTLIAQPFYDYSPRVFFTKNSPFISSYIDLTNQNIINELENTEFVKVDVPGVLGLFQNIKLQQHRLGVMLGVFKQFNNIHFNFKIPLYYMIEHFFLTPDEVNKIENNPFFTSENTGEGITPDDNVEAFALKHLVSDRWGLGDSRLTALYNFYDSDCFQAWLGLQATIPTAVSFQRGIIAAEFNPDCPIPPFDIKRLFNLAFCFSGAQQREANIVIKKETTDFLVGALDRLSTILINTPLGNNKHFGIGPQINLRYILNDYWSMHTYAVIETFLMHKEKRFFLIEKNPKDFDRDYTNEANAEQNLLFLNAQLINTIYPHPVCINVRPGFITKFNHVFMFDSACWHGSLGFDYWRQEKEKFERILDGCITKPLAIKKGIRPSAQQGSFFGNFGYYGSAYCDRITWHALLTGEATIFNQGIGKSFTVGIRAGIDF